MPRQASQPELRPIGADDLAPCVAVFYAALEDLRERRGEAPWPRNEPALARLFGRLVASHPGGAWQAAVDGETVGFGIAIERERLWFLAFLFVLPGQQAAGVGRRLLERTLPAGGADAWRASGGVLATCVEAAQLVSTGLYASHGLVPRTPLYLLVGRPAAGVLAALPEEIESVAFEAFEADGGAGVLGDMLDIVDLSALGHRRAIDHRDDRAEGRSGWLYRVRAGGRAVGYGYTQASGRLGPVAVMDAALLEPVIGHLMGTLEPPGPWQLFVPGPSAALPALLRAGFRFEDAPALLSASAPYVAAERYLLRSYALP